METRSLIKKIDVRGNAAGMKNLKEISGQTNTPTLQWNGEILADFGVEELERFLAKRAQ